MKKIIKILLTMFVLIYTTNMHNNFVIAESLTAENDTEEVSLFQNETPSFLYVNIEKGSSLALRRNPKKDSSVITKLHRDDYVEVIECNDSWTHVRFNGNEGYVLNRYLSDAPSPDDLGTYIIDSDGRVKVRKYPDGDKKFYVYPDDEVTVISFFYQNNEQYPSWAKIKTSDGIGYIKYEFLQKKEEE